ncbi:MAG: DUF2927 domain-containing protein, partial [Silicimonas sp.]|nr:DUF2927 domain-containing protein [Silicimonas sp.]
VLTLVACLAIGACTTSETSRRAGPDIALPPMKTFSSVAVRAPAKSNARIARDFLDLAFTLENGAKMPRFTRFEGPITVRVTGPAPASLSPDLDRLLARRDVSEVVQAPIARQATRVNTGFIRPSCI